MLEALLYSIHLADGALVWKEHCLSADLETDCRKDTRPLFLLVSFAYISLSPCENGFAQSSVAKLRHRQDLFNKSKHIIPIRTELTYKLSMIDFLCHKS